MAETNEVLPACPCPTTATFLTFSPVYTFTGSPPSEATNLTQRKLQAQLGEAGALGHATDHGERSSPVRSSDRSTSSSTTMSAGHSCPTSLQIPEPSRYA